MSNNIPAVKSIISRMQRGWPEGTEELHREIPKLLARIEELEVALIPFARVGRLEYHSPQNLATVYTKDCVHAYNVMDPTQGKQPPRDNFFDNPAQ